MQDVTQKQQPFYFKLKKKHSNFLRNEGQSASTFYNIKFKPTATFSFDHISVFMLISFFALNFSYPFTNTGYAMKTQFLLANLLLGYVVLAFGIEIKYVKYCGK